MLHSRHDLDDGFALSARGGDCQLFHLGGGVVKVSYRGLATADFAEHVTRELEQGLARFQPIELFIDAEALRSYQSDFRKAWTNWLLQNQHCLSGMHMLFQSRVVEMGVNLVNSVVHDFVTPYADREEFEARLATALAERSSQL